MDSLLTVDAKYFSVMNESMQTTKLNTLIGKRLPLKNVFKMLHQLQCHLSRYSALVYVRARVFQVVPQTGDEVSTCPHSTSAVTSSAYSTTDVTTSTEHSDYKITSSSACYANIIIDYPVNEMKTTLARHMTCGVCRRSFETALHGC